MFAKFALTKTIKETTFERLIVKFKDPQSQTMADDFLKDMRRTLTPYRDQNLKVYNYANSQNTLAKVESILNIIFMVIIAITMFLCFFSLSSSMSANLYEQSKEIGIMRATGFTKKRVYLLYIYEAFILVLSSSLLGILIGTIVGFTMTLQ
jgi:ABC-type antimicrobial peptide transport system permease subunit